MHETRRTDNPEYRRLFDGYDYQVSVSSFLDGSLTGKLYLDDLDSPRSGLMLNPEGTFIAGDPGNREFNIWLSGFMEDIIQTRVHPMESDADDLWFYIDNPGWVDSFPDIFVSRPPFKVGRHHYSIDLPSRGLGSIPEGYSINRVDSDLDVDSLNFPVDVWEWVEDSLDEYLERGFGAALTHGGNVVSWSNADCSSGDRCEIGIITTDSLRRKGFGSLTVLAALDYCYELGFREVGWHCEAHNHGSIGTALKVGFTKRTDYYAWVCKFEKETHEKESEILKKYYP